MPVQLLFSHVVAFVFVNPKSSITLAHAHERFRDLVMQSKHPNFSHSYLFTVQK